MYDTILTNDGAHRPPRPATAELREPCEPQREPGLLLVPRAEDTTLAAHDAVDNEPSSVRARGFKHVLLCLTASEAGSGSRLRGVPGWRAGAHGVRAGELD